MTLGLKSHNKNQRCERARVSIYKTVRTIVYIKKKNIDEFRCWFYSIISAEFFFAIWKAIEWNSAGGRSKMNRPAEVGKERENEARNYEESRKRRGKMWRVEIDGWGWKMSKRGSEDDGDKGERDIGRQRDRKRRNICIVLKDDKRRCKMQGKSKWKRVARNLPPLPSSRAVTTSVTSVSRHTAPRFYYSVHVCRPNALLVLWSSVPNIAIDIITFLCIQTQVTTKNSL